MTPGALARSFAVFDANLEALAAYRPRRYDGEVVIVRAADLADAARDRGWTRWLQRPAIRVDVRGDHYSLLTSPTVESLALLLSEHLR